MKPNQSTSVFINSAYWAVLSAFSFAVMITAVHYMEGKFDAFEIVFFSSSGGFVSYRSNGLSLWL